MDTLRPAPGEITKLADIITHWAGKAPDRVALTAGDRTWTYGQIDTEARQVAQGLIELGVGAGDRIAYLDRNTPEYFMHLFGGAKLNAVSVAVNWRLAPPEMEYIIDDADAKVLFVGEEFVGHLDRMNLPKVELVVVIGDPGGSGHHTVFVEQAVFERVATGLGEQQGDDGRRVDDDHAGSPSSS